MNSNYREIRNFGVNAGLSEIINPMSYCLNTGLTNGFLHGSSSENFGLNTYACQYFLTQYCSNEWDDYCEIASLRTDNSVPNSQLFPGMNASIYNLTAGEMLVRNTFIQKYLVEVKNGKVIYEPFDPTVASSPMIARWVKDEFGGEITFTYDVNPSIIDSCPLMNRILASPNTCNDILNSIYLKRVRENKTHELKGTFLGKFYQLNGMPI